MQQDSGRTLANFVQHLAIQAFLGTARLLPFRARGNWFATAGRFAIPRVPSLRNRMAEGMRLVYPDLTEAELSDFIRRTAANTPIGSAIRVASSIETKASSRVAGSRSSTRSSAGTR